MTQQSKVIEITLHTNFKSFCLQIQFGILLAHTLQIMSSSCPMPNLYLYGMLPDVIVLFYLFYKFYKNTYNTKTKNAQSKITEKIK